jgi:flagellar biosynthetic protein FlhB
MAEDAAEKTEEPTPKRLEDARRKGQVASSRDVSSVIVLALALGSLAGFGLPRLFQALAGQAAAAWGGSEIVPHTVGDFHAVILAHGSTLLVAFLPLALLLMLAGATSNVVQTGLMFSTEALGFKANRISPVQGFKRLFSPDRLFDLAKAPLKVGVVGAAMAFTMVPALEAVLSLVSAPPIVIGQTMRALGVQTAGIALFGLSALAVGDFVWVRNRHRKQLRMSLREVRDEMRERDGSPEVRSRRRQVQREMSRRRMIAEVALADVVLVNPTHFAIALRYVRGEMAAPKVLARGRGAVAERIRREARRHDVPIVENPPLTRLLYKSARVGKEIPESLFEAVAEVLALVYRMDRRRAGAWGARA